MCFLFLGELENAQSTLQRCLELDPTFVDAHLLMSQIYLAQGNFAMCSHCLELGVSHNFQVGARHTVWPTQLLHPFPDSCLGGGKPHKGIRVPPRPSANRQAGLAPQLPWRSSWGCCMTAGV